MALLLFLFTNIETNLKLTSNRGAKFLKQKRKKMEGAAAASHNGDKEQIWYYENRGAGEN